MSLGGRSRVFQPTVTPVVVTQRITGGTAACETFEFVSPNGGSETIQVPAGVSFARIECWGAAGGGGAALEFGPGLGGYIAVLVPVFPRETLQVNCGRGGFSTALDVFGGGGGAGTANSVGQSGGGATDVRRSPYALTDRLVVAGGGGGPSTGDSFARGGHGGYPDGTAGSNATSGQGGTATAGGAGGVDGARLGEAGELGIGGAGHQAGLGALAEGGGGGGGWYGGGGGAVTGAGGGGSSGFLEVSSAGTATLITHQTGIWGPSGVCRICWIPT